MTLPRDQEHYIVVQSAYDDPDDLSGAQVFAEGDLPQEFCELELGAYRVGRISYAAGTYQRELDQ